MGKWVSSRQMVQGEGTVKAKALRLEVSGHWRSREGSVAGEAGAFRGAFGKSQRGPHRFWKGLQGCCNKRQVRKLFSIGVQVT